MSLAPLGCGCGHTLDGMKSCRTLYIYIYKYAALPQLTEGYAGFLSSRVALGVGVVGFKACVTAAAPPLDTGLPQVFMSQQNQELCGTGTLPLRP